MKHFITVVSFCVVGVLSVYAQTTVKHGDKFSSPTTFRAQNDVGNGGTGLEVVDASFSKERAIGLPEDAIRVIETTSLEAALIMARQVGDVSFMAVRDILDYASMVNREGSLRLNDVRAKAAYFTDIFASALHNAHVIYKKALYDNQSEQSYTILSLIIEALDELQESLSLCQLVLGKTDSPKEAANKALLCAKNGRKLLDQAHAYTMRDIMNSVALSQNTDGVADQPEDRATLMDIISVAAQSIVQLHDRAVAAAQESFEFASALAADAKFSDLDIAFQRVDLACNILWAAARNAENIAIKILNNKQTSKIAQFTHAMRDAIERGKFIALIISRVCDFAARGMPADATRVAKMVLEHTHDMEALVGVVCELAQYRQSGNKSLETMPIETSE